jgi:hypothetical protein
VPMLMPSRVASAFISRYSWVSMLRMVMFMCHHCVICMTKYLIVFLCSILVTWTLLLHHLTNNIPCPM